MPRGCRCIFLAFVGIALAGASPPNQPDQNSAASGNQTEAAAGAYQPDPNRNSERCYENANHEAADLCAQWSAADAAKETASISYWGNWIAGFGALLSFASILLVLWALRQGREANDIAKDTAKRELRAYVIGKNHRVEGLRAGLRPTFVVEIHNFGQTPAHELRCVTSVWATPDSVDDYRCRFRDKGPLVDISSTLVGPGDFHPMPNTYKAPLALEHWQMIMSGRIKLIFGGVISYRDIFGRRRLSTFRYFLDPDDLRTNKITYDLTATTRGGKAN